MIKVVRESTSLTWTRTPPTAPGHYWLRFQVMKDETYCKVVEVYQGRTFLGRPKLWIHWPGSECDEMLDDQVHQYGDCEWAGPIPQPQEAT